MPDILLATLNARYIHASLGLRYLFANLGAHQAAAEIVEFVITERPIDIAEAILARSPRIVGFGVYIWNVEETAKVIALLKTVRPDLHIVLGGPEVSYECDEQPIVALADYVITGWGDVTFATLCAELIGGQRREQKIIAGLQPRLNDLALPYRYYTDQDIARRLIYVEASRGCPFKCEFCLSSLDKTAWPFDLDRFLAEIQSLHERGARHFKFVDRTFNLNIRSSQRILEFFLERLDDQLFLHFELIPDHLPDPLKAIIERFPAGQLQFEIGIQSWDPSVQSLISRRQDNQQSEANIRWLRDNTGAHLHTDLIVGLPGETLAGFAAGFDRLVALRPHEIQVGILKRLRGTPIARHTQPFSMQYSPHPPYNILANALLDFPTMQRLQRFARYWDLIGNSGRFVRTMPLLLGSQPFERFLGFADWLYARTGQTHAIALDRLFDLIYAAMTEFFLITDEGARGALVADYGASGARGAPMFLRGHAPQRPGRRADTHPAGATRQARHQRPVSTQAGEP
ncbi:MAG: DUF4080 domain-containing protein [Burkholderiales bacterium]